MYKRQLFGLFAEPASTVFVTATENHIGAIEKLAGEYNFFVSRIGTTGGNRLEISVDREPFIFKPLDELRRVWAKPLEASPVSYTHLDVYKRQLIIIDYRYKRYNRMFNFHDFLMTCAKSWPVK